MDNKKEAMSDVLLYVLDMDGTIYLGKNLIEGSLDFIEKVREVNKNFIFFTNNSSKTSLFYKDKLAKMGCNVEEKDIMTSGDVTIEFLKTNYSGKKVFILGTPLLEDSFKDNGIELVEDNPDIVVVAFDMTLTYEKLEKACTFIRNGATFLATHLDINCPTEDGFIPDCGAMCELITKSTGVLPKYLGKPCPETIDMVLSITGFKKEEVAFVGDRIYTDVATGVNNGAKGFLVLTGETKIEDVDISSVRPTCVYDSLKEMSKYL